MVVEIRSLTSAPFCRCGVLVPLEWTRFELPAHIVAALREERSLSVRDAARAPEPVRPQSAQQQQPQKPRR